MRGLAARFLSSSRAVGALVLLAAAVPVAVGPVPPAAAVEAPAPGDPCPEGTYHEDEDESLAGRIPDGESTCTTVPAGFVPTGAAEDGTGATGVDACDPGTYKAATGAGECIDIPAGPVVGRHRRLPRRRVPRRRRRSGCRSRRCRRRPRRSPRSPR